MGVLPSFCRLRREGAKEVIGDGSDDVATVDGGPCYSSQR
jgi:hypothetical protein